MITWQCKEPGPQQAQYLPSSARMFWATPQEAQTINNRWIFRWNEVTLGDGTTLLGSTFFWGAGERFLNDNHNENENIFIVKIERDKLIYCSLSGKLWYLQHNFVGDTIVYH